MNQEEQTMKTTFKKISAILASVLLAVGITAVMKRNLQTHKKQHQQLNSSNMLAKFVLGYLVINHHLVMLMHKAKAKALMLKLVKRSVKIY